MNDLQLLKDIGAIKTFKANDYIFRQDEPGDEMYIILSGSVGVYINSGDGSLINVSHLGSGDFFGEVSVLEDIPRNSSAIAEAETVVIAIIKNNFQTAICEPSSVPYKIMKGLSNQVGQLYKELSKCTAGTQLGAKLDAKGDAGRNEEVAVGKEQAENAEISDNNPSDIVLNPIINGYGPLFPEGHKKYNLIAPKVCNDFLMTVQAKCPVCTEGFEAKKQFISKLKFEKMDFDFRKHYTDFEPLWYSIWVCPHCYYANFNSEYDAIPTYKTQNVLARTQELKKQFSFQFSEPRIIHQVFTAYYLALCSAEFYNANSLKFAKIWMQLSWLYHDVNDEEMFNTASSLALKNYYDVIYKTGLNLTIEQTQQCFLLLGELYLIKGDEKEAARHFYTAIKKNGGKEAFNQQAEERIHDIRRGKISFDF